ncbi:MAG TPA: TetR family transcriptional regulator C-terminal domain-containing protein [Acidimicrobiales bacterium]|nr:TetR family transcriptional regulator C-terminal domain-containing protein [Acidimicrobiales bacterium]
MPKIVDHDARRAELARAVWAVARREGIEHASVRTVAAEAGCSAGSLRHYFPNQSDLLAFALQVVVDRIRSRLAGIDRDREPRRAARHVLHELLPLDDERRAENEVWLAFTARALVDPSLREIQAEVDQALRRTWIDIAQALGVDRPRLEGERLHALVDGLCVHAALNGDRLPAARIRAVIDHHLGTLAGRQPATS